MNKKFIALIGAGYWGKNLARVFSKLGVLHTIYDISENVAKEIASKYNVNYKYNNIDEIFQNEHITSVAIAAPASQHYELAKKSLKYNKNVFVEKPLSLYMTEARDLVNISKSKNKILMVGHLLQYHPCINKIKEVIKQNTIGNIHYISSNRLNLGKFRKEENSLWSLAPHDFSVILSLMDDQLPEIIQSVGGAYLKKNLHDTTVSNMKFKNGVRAHVYVNWMNPFKEQKLTIIGSEGMIVFDDMKSWDEKLVIYNQKLVLTNDNIKTCKDYNYKYIITKEKEPLQIECEHFMNCCINNSKPITCGDEGMRVLSLLSGAQESLECDGLPVKL